MKKILFKENKDYFDFFNKYREQITIYKLDFTKKWKIRVFYDIM